jgi:hypothetical protein
MSTNHMPTISALVVDVWTAVEHLREAAEATWLSCSNVRQLKVAEATWPSCTNVKIDNNNQQLTACST